MQKVNFFMKRSWFLISLFILLIGISGLSFAELVNIQYAGSSYGDCGTERIGESFCPDETQAWACMVLKNLGTGETIYFWSHSVCSNKCENGKCIDEKFDISSVEGVKEVYNSGEELNLVIKGVEKDGTPGTPEEGFNVQYYIDEWPLVSGQGSIGDNARYKEGYWYGSIKIPDKVSTYRLEVFLYCSIPNSLCEQRYEEHAQVQKTYYFATVQSTQTCIDSDGGKNYYEKGYVKMLNDTTFGIKGKKYDFCWDDGIHLQEYVCEDGKYLGDHSYRCPNGCKDGACVPEINITPVCKPAKCEDGTIPECKIAEGQCVCSTCPPIIVKPICGNGICEAGEGEVCVSTTEEKISCEEGKECKVPPSTCSIACPQDCRTEETINVNLDEEFKLRVNQIAKVGDNLQITFKDLIAYKCKESEVGVIEEKKIKEKAAVAEIEITGRATTEIVVTQPSTAILKCIGAGPKALLRLDLRKEETTKNMIINLDLGEKKQIKDLELTISFLSYDYASRTGTFLISKEIFSCPEKCKCDENGNVIECARESCKEGETLCPDGKCREKCEIITQEDCKYGCMYEGKCFPMGIRIEGLYCSDNSIMTSQKAGDEVCDNNFECLTNVCVDGKCVSSGLIQKIISFFKKLFG